MPSYDYHLSIISYSWSLRMMDRGFTVFVIYKVKKTALNGNHFTRPYYKNVIKNQNSFTPRILKLQ
jgi:hypothetical protein